MAGLLALVAYAILLTGAVARQMSKLAAVVTLLSLGTVARQVAVATTRVACLLAAAHAAVAAGRRTTVSTIGSALTRDVSDLATLVAFGTSGTSESSAHGTSSSGIIALARQVTRLSAPVARLLLLGARAFTAHVAILSTVVTHGSTTLGAVTGLMSSLAAVVAGASANHTTASVVVTSEVHCEL